MSKNNVHPDHYKVGGRDRQDDAAAARFAQAVAGKASSQQRPDRMTKGPYFQRPEQTPSAPAARPAKPARRKSSPRPGTAKKSAARKASGPSRRPATRKSPKATRKAPKKRGRTAKPAKAATRKK